MRFSVTVRVRARKLLARPGRALDRPDRLVPEHDDDEDEDEEAGDDEDYDDEDDGGDDDIDYLSHALFLPPPSVVLALQLEKKNQITACHTGGDTNVTNVLIYLLSFDDFPIYEKGQVTVSLNLPCFSCLFKKVIDGGSEFPSKLVRGDKWTCDRR